MHHLFRGDTVRIKSEEIEEVEVGYDENTNARYIKVCFKDGSFEKFAATIQSDMYGITPSLSSVEAKHLVTV